MKKLVRLSKVLEDAESQGIDPDSILVNPDQVQHLIEPDDSEDSEAADKNS